MIDLAKMTGIIDGKYQPLCKLAVSPQYAARGYNGAPNSTKASLNNIPVVDNYFDFSTGSSTSDNVNCGDLFFESGGGFEITIDFKPDGSAKNLIQTNLNNLVLDQFNGLRLILTDDNGVGKLFGASYGDYLPLSQWNRVISTINVQQERWRSITSYDDGYYQYNNFTPDFTLSSYTFNSILFGGSNGFTGKAYNLYITKTKHYDPDKIKAIHKILRGK